MRRVGEEGKEGGGAPAATATTAVYIAVVNATFISLLSSESVVDCSQFDTFLLNTTTSPPEMRTSQKTEHQHHHAKVSLRVRLSPVLGLYQPCEKRRQSTAFSSPSPNVRRKKGKKDVRVSPKHMP